MNKRLFTVLSLVAAMAGCAAYGPPSGEKWAELTLGNRPTGARRDLNDPSPQVRRWAILRLTSRGDLSATCSAARCSETLIASPRNIASIRARSPHDCASCSNNRIVSLVIRFFE